MPQITVKDLLEAGIHYGHRTSRWNPKMEPYIYGKRKLIHIVDIRKTIRGIILSSKLLEKVVSQGKDVIFVGAKRQARNAVRDAALRCNMHYVNERWIGGTLTNFSVIRSRVERLKELEAREETGEINSASKKEGAALRRELDKMRRNLDGIRNMDRQPGVMVVIDPRREKNAVAEANTIGIPVICLADTDSDPDVADVLIPGNDDAMRAIQIVLNNLSEAALAGVEKRQAVAPVQAAPEPTEKTQTPPKRRTPREKGAEEKSSAGAEGARRVSKPPRKGGGGGRPQRRGRPGRTDASPSAQKDGSQQAPKTGERQSERKPAENGDSKPEQSEQKTE